MARRRRVAARDRHVRARDPGQRQGSRPCRGLRRPPRGRADRAGEGVAPRSSPARRQGDPPGDRRAAQARELRRLRSSVEQGRRVPRPAAPAEWWPQGRSEHEARDGRRARGGGCQRRRERESTRAKRTRVDHLSHFRRSFATLRYRSGR